MLLSLSINHFVLAKNVNLNFETGFSVLTGETGAGKSLTLDAIALILGGKADYSQIEHGEDKAQISAVFDLSELPHLQEYLAELKFAQKGDNELSIRRILDVRGKSHCYVNNQAVTLAQLKGLGRYLIDIHGQNEYHSLNSEQAQRQLLDAFSGAESEVLAVKEAWKSLQTMKARLEKTQRNAQHLALEQERLAWQCDEFSRVAPTDGEWETISRSHEILAHTADLLQAAQYVGELLDKEGGVLSLLNKCRQNLSPLAHVFPAFQEALTLLESADVELSEISALMRNSTNRTELDENLLKQQENRMQELLSLARKYRVEPETLPQKWLELQQALEKVEESADLALLEEELKALQVVYDEAAESLRHKRQKGAQKLAAKTEENMQQLAMKGAKFHIELIATQPTSNGTEQIQYQVAVNAGSLLRPLAKVASGGELSRISLALQMSSAHHTTIPTLIFDEVDTGIGGAVADTVGHALSTLGNTRQIITITHLPQVAVYAKQHYQVKKHQQKDKTFTQIKLLDETERVDEIASMAGGNHIGAAAKEAAAELLAAAKNRRETGNTP